jgi:hypothetical protein
MPLDDFSGEAARMSIVNTVTTEAMEVPFNPTEFEEIVEANYARLTVPGLGYEPLQFIGTKNTKYNLDLYCDGLTGLAAEEVNGIHQFRRFLMALCYPQRSATSVAGGGAPRALFIWPNVVRLTCVITQITFRHTRFNLEGKTVLYTARVALEEIRDFVIHMEDVLNLGTERTR